MKFATQKFSSIGEKTNSKNVLQWKAEKEMGREIRVTRPEEQKPQELELDSWDVIVCNAVKKYE